MILSSLLASLVSLDANYLTQQAGYPWLTVLFFNGISGFVCAVIAWAVQLLLAFGKAGYPPGFLGGTGWLYLAGSPHSRPWLVLNGVLAAVQVACAFSALSLLTLAEANIIMFTSPAFTSVLACVLLKQKFKKHDLVVTIACVVGVVLVESPWQAPPSGPRSVGDTVLGLFFALVFALTLSANCILANSKLREEALCTISLYVFGTISLSAWVTFPLLDNTVLYSPTEANNLAIFPLLAIGIAFLGFQYLRTFAFQTSKGAAAVANLLYTEIMFALTWNTAILDEPVNYWNIIGAVVIAGGAFVTTWLQDREARRVAAGATGADDEMAINNINDITSIVRSSRLMSFSNVGDMLLDSSSVKVREEGRAAGASPSTSVGSRDTAGQPTCAMSLMFALPCFGFGFGLFTCVSSIDGNIGASGEHRAHTAVTVLLLVLNLLVEPLCWAARRCKEQWTELQWASVQPVLDCRQPLRRVTVYEACLSLICALVLLQRSPLVPMRWRREVREWSPVELYRLRTAIFVMNNHTTQQGRIIYGPKFISMSQLVIQHAVAVLDPRGDQGHSNWSPDEPQPCFYTFHQTLLFAIESSINAVDPRIGTLPYWDTELDSPGGAYYGTSMSIYNIVGASVGSKAHNYGVVDGVMAHATVARYPEEGAAEPEVTDGARRLVPQKPQGWLRAHDLAPGSNDTWLIQRYEPENAEQSLILIPGGNASTTTPHFPASVTDASRLSSAVVMTKQMILTCRGTMELAKARKAAGQLNINTYTACMDFGTFDMHQASMPCPPGNEAQPRASLQWQQGQCQQLWQHSQAHFRIGGQSKVGLNITHPGWEASWVYDGDFIDLATSPNDALVFILWHTNMMRHFLRWQQQAVLVDPMLPRRNWDYPLSRNEYSGLNPGCELHHTINSVMPMVEGVFPRPPSNPDGYTHYDALYWTSPGMGQVVDYIEHDLTGDWSSIEATVNHEQVKQ